MKIEELKSTANLYVSEIKSNDKIIFYNIKCDNGYYIKYDNNYFEEGYIPIKNEYDISLITQQEYNEIIKHKEYSKELSKL